MFVTIMRIARISGLRRGHLTADFVPELRVGSFLKSDSAGCNIGTIEPPSSDRLSAHPLYIPTCAPHAHMDFSPPSFRAMSRRRSYSGLLYQEPPHFWSRLKFWRTTAPN